MNKSEKAKLAEIVDVVSEALEYLESGRVNAGLQFMKVARRRINILRSEAEKPKKGELPA